MQRQGNNNKNRNRGGEGGGPKRYNGNQQQPNSGGFNHQRYHGGNGNSGFSHQKPRYNDHFTGGATGAPEQSTNSSSKDSYFKGGSSSQSDYRGAQGNGHAVNPESRHQQQP